MANGDANRIPVMAQAAADKKPLEWNVYAFARNPVGTPTPAFPHADEGAMVPAEAGSRDVRSGRFGFVTRGGGHRVVPRAVDFMPDWDRGTLT